MSNVKHLNKICYVVKITSSLYCVIKMTNIVSKRGFEIFLRCYKFLLYHNSSYRGDGNNNFAKLWLCYDHIWHEGVIIITTYSKIYESTDKQSHDLYKSFYWKRNNMLYCFVVNSLANFFYLILQFFVHLKRIDSADSYEQFLTATMPSLNICKIVMASSIFLAAVTNFGYIIIRHIEVMGITTSLSFDFVMITFDMREL
jgi:hypothetical protein